jgi:hypothetical protein
VLVVPILVALEILERLELPVALVVLVVLVALVILFNPQLGAQSPVLAAMTLKGLAA